MRLWLAALVVASSAQGEIVWPEVPNEPVVLLVHHDSRRLRWMEAGALVAEYAIAIGQEDGQKRRLGDLRTPKGLYYVVAKSRPPPEDAYFGGFFLKLNYPGASDAAWGLAAGLITRAQHDAIVKAWSAREPTPNNTKLGRGIGLHGWAHDWSESSDGTNLSWGCIVLHNEDVAVLYERIRIGTAVLLF